jgi:hypothetical protein
MKNAHPGYTIFKRHCRAYLVSCPRNPAAVDQKFENLRRLVRVDLTNLASRLLLQAPIVIERCPYHLLLQPKIWLWHDAKHPANIDLFLSEELEI